MTKPLAGRHALVTGGGRGIGAAIARHLLSLGAIRCNINFFSKLYSFKKVFWFVGKFSTFFFKF